MPFSFSLYQGDLYFSATENTNGRELWRTDGFTGGAEMVKNIASGNTDGLSVQGGSLVFNDELYFSAASGASVLLRTCGGVTALNPAPTRPSMQVLIR